MMTKRLLLMVFIAIFLIGCLPPGRSLSCDEIMATPLAENVGEAIALEDLLQYTEHSFRLGREDIRIETYEEGRVRVVVWNKGGIKYMVSIRDDVLNEIRIHYESTRPAAKQVIVCLQKQPSWYVAIYGDNFPIPGGKRYLFELYFPDAGVFAQLQDSGQHIKRPPTLDANIPLSLLVFIEPGSLEEIYFRAKHSRRLKEQPPVQWPKPWPGNWEEVRWIENNGPGW